MDGKERPDRYFIMLQSKITVAVVKSHAVKIVEEPTLWRTLVDLKKVFKAKVDAEGALPPLSFNEMGLKIEPIVEEVVHEIDLKEVDAKARAALAQQRAKYAAWLEKCAEVAPTISRSEKLIATISDEALKRTLNLQLESFKKANGILPRPLVSTFDDLVVHYYNIELSKINRGSLNTPMNEASLLQKFVNSERERRLTLEARAKSAQMRAEKEKAVAEEVMALLNK